MKLQLLTVLVVVAGAFALPRSSSVVVVAESINEPIQRNNVENGIRSFFNLLSAIVKLIGFDPLNIVNRKDFEFAPPGSDDVVKGFVENLQFTGLSDYRIHTLNYNQISSRLFLDISLPEISLTIGDSSLEGLVNGKEVETQVKGSLLIKSIRLVVDLHVDVGFGTVGIRSLAVNFSLGGIESDLTVVSQGNDVSDDVNKYFGEEIPASVDDNRDEINNRIDDFIRRFINRIYNS